MSKQRCCEKDFEFLDLIDSGSFGSISRVRRKDTGEVFALKKIHLAPGELAHEIDEINMILGLNHPCIVKYEDWFFDEKEDLCIVMELCDTNLEELVQKKKMTLIEISAILHEALLALEYLHELKTMHRDIKPANFLLTKDGQVKLCDFGISAQLTTVAKTSTKAGTLMFMSPELLMNRKHDCKTDIWSLGITLLYMYNRKLPYPDIGLSATMTYMLINPAPRAPSTAPEDFQRLVAKMLVKDPDERSTAKDLLNEPFIKLSEGDRRAIIRHLCEKADDTSVTIVFTDVDDLENKQETEEEDEEDEEEAYGDSATFIDFTPTNQPSRELISHKEAEPDVAHEPAQDTTEEPMEPVERRRFKNYSAPDLEYLLQHLRQFTENQLVTNAGTSRDKIISSYTDLRSKILKELERKGVDHPDDYQLLHS